MSINPNETQKQPPHDDMGENAPQDHEVPPADFTGKPEEHQQESSGIVQDALNRTIEEPSHHVRNIILGITAVSVPVAGVGIYIASNANSSPETARTAATSTRTPGTKAPSTPKSIQTSQKSPTDIPSNLTSSPGSSTSERASETVKYKGTPKSEMENSPADPIEWMKKFPLADRLAYADSEIGPNSSGNVQGGLNRYIKSDVAANYIQNLDPKVTDDGQTIIDNNLFMSAIATAGYLSQKNLPDGSTIPANDYNKGMKVFSSIWVTSSPYGESNISQLKNIYNNIKSAEDGSNQYEAYTTTAADNFKAVSTVDGPELEIEGQKCPTKTIHVTGTSDSDYDLVMALYAYPTMPTKNAPSRLAKQWVEVQTIVN